MGGRKNSLVAALRFDTGFDADFYFLFRSHISRPNSVSLFVRGLRKKASHPAEAEVIRRN